MKINRPMIQLVISGSQALATVRYVMSSGGPGLKSSDRDFSGGGGGGGSFSSISLRVGL
jgi:hypothetical protein